LVDEHIIVLEGTATVAYGGDVILDVRAGETAKLPRGVPHAWGNRTETELRMALICLPGGIEEILGAFAKADPAEIRRLLQHFNVKQIGPAPF
jgi:uncharacterized cupin superfamily protein